MTRWTIHTDPYPTAPDMRPCACGESIVVAAPQAPLQILRAVKDHRLGNSHQRWIAAGGMDMIEREAE